MKKYGLLPIALLLLSVLLVGCGQADLPHADWRTAGKFSSDYPITPTQVFCVRLNDEKNAYEVYRSANGTKAGELDFAAHSDSTLYYGEDLDTLEFSDHDGDGYNDFGVPMADGNILWYSCNRNGGETADNLFAYADTEKSDYATVSENVSSEAGSEAVSG